METETFIPEQAMPPFGPGEPPPEIWRRAWRGRPLPAWRFYAELPSTQDAAREWAEMGAWEGCLVYTEHQTQGRGRQGRPWYARPGSSLTFSYIVRPLPQEHHALGHVPGWAAVAVCTALEDTLGLAPRIKWPNDILLEGKKVGGILVEMFWEAATRPVFAVVGIGLNVRPDAIPPGVPLEFPAASLEDYTKEPVSRPHLLVALWEALTRWRRELGRETLLRAWEARLAYRGEAVWIQTQEEKPGFAARLLGLTREGYLRVIHFTGEEEILLTVRHLRPLGAT